MLQFLKGRGYTKQEIFLLRSTLEDAQYLLQTSWTECDAYGEKCCSECYAKRVCKDYDRIINYLISVENSVETVENKKSAKNP